MFHVLLIDALKRSQVRELLEYLYLPEGSTHKHLSPLLAGYLAGLTDSAIILSTNQTLLKQHRSIHSPHHVL